MIKKSLFLRQFAFATFFSNLDATFKIYLGIKTMTKRCNQADLDYFDSHFNRAHGKDEIVLIGKYIYYRNIVLFIQHLQGLVTF